MAGIAIKTFTSSGSWTAPAGITLIQLIGWGGGAGGGAGAGGGTGTNAQSAGGTGGGGALKVIQWVTVVPGTSYTITIGAGGTGGASVGAGTSGNNGSDGSNTTFTTPLGVSLATFAGGGKGLGGFVGLAFNQYAIFGGGCSVANTQWVQAWGGNTVGYGFISVLPSFGGFTGVYAQIGGAGSLPTNGGSSPEGFLGGTSPIFNPGSGSFYEGTQGSGGGGGPAGVGGNGGANGGGNGAGVGGTGSGGKTSSGLTQTAATTGNTGAGGGGGGGGGYGSTGGGGGGAGGGGDNGKLIITWYE